ncbi:polyprenyl synthetase family protein [Mycobacterium simiae]|nr:polyprenyl synthetase family protein [Mycobacterium simiae]
MRPSAPLLAADFDLGGPRLSASVRRRTEQIHELISNELSNDDEAMRDAVVAISEAGSMPLRALVTVLAAQLGPNPDTWQVTVAGATLELIHQAALCHNNVAQPGEVRRGAFGGNAHWNNNIAILTGDYQFAMASRLGSRLGPIAFRVIAETFAELVTGHMYEIRGAAPDVDSIAHYLQTASQKRGALVAAAGHLGATFAGATDETILRLTRLGRLIGTASQIADDIMGIANDFDKSGDVPGIHRWNGEHTLPVLYALREPGPNADRLRKSLADPIDEDKIAEAITLLRCSTAVLAANDVLASYAAQAREELAGLPACAARQAFFELIDSTISRCTYHSAATPRESPPGRSGNH